MNRKKVFEIKNLFFKYENSQHYTLNNINFDIYENSFISIIGSNGAGKSTLMDILLGYRLNYEGSVKFFDHEIKNINLDELAKYRAYIPQQLESNLYIKTYEYLNLVKLINKNITDNDINNLLTQFQLEYLYEKSINQMSGGEQRLIQLIFTLLLKPKILLLDEPIFSLDINKKEKFFEILTKLKENITIICILHDLDFAAYYSDEIIFLNNGTILKIGKPTEVLNFKTLGEAFFTKPIDKVNLSLNFSKKLNVNNKLKVHIICGGGNGEQIIQKLMALNFKISCGVLNVGDSDWNFCKLNNINIIEEEPYKPISYENYLNNVKLIEEADIIIICQFPVGSGNLLNLKFIDDIKLKDNQTLILINDTKNNFLDYTNGIAVEYINKIKKNAKIITDSKNIENELINLIQ